MILARYLLQEMGLKCVTMIVIQIDVQMMYLCGRSRDPVQRSFLES
jgi:hypothetical protein